MPLRTFSFTALQDLLSQVKCGQAIIEGDEVFLLEQLLQFGWVTAQKMSDETYVNASITRAGHNIALANALFTPSKGGRSGVGLLTSA